LLCDDHWLTTDAFKSGENGTFDELVAEDCFDDIGTNGLLLSSLFIWSYLLRIMFELEDFSIFCCFLEALDR